MREVKFRAWVSDDDENFFMCRDITGYDSYKHLVSNKDYNYYNFELMQYTGLKDKNGVELWENDLLELDKNRLCQVVWHKESGRWDLKFISEKKMTPKFIPCGIDNVRNRGEVIGNIYENPELLKKRFAIMQPFN